MDLQAAIAGKVQAFQQEKESNKEKGSSQFHARIELLKPILTLLQDGLKGTHFSATLHTDPSHSPCPAIHIRGAEPLTPAYDRLSELFMPKNDDDGFRWRAGSVNRHEYGLKDDAALLDFVATWVAYDIANRKSA